MAKSYRSDSSNKKSRKRDSKKDKKHKKKHKKRRSPSPSPSPSASSSVSLTVSVASRHKHKSKEKTKEKTKEKEKTKDKTKDNTKDKTKEKEDTSNNLIKGLKDDKPVEKEDVNINNPNNIINEVSKDIKFPNFPKFPPVGNNNNMDIDNNKDNIININELVKESEVILNNPDEDINNINMDLDQEKVNDDKQINEGINTSIENIVKVNNSNKEDKFDDKDDDIEINQDTMNNLEKELNNLYQLDIDNQKFDFSKINYQEISNGHRKLVIYNLPPIVNKDEIKHYFYTLLTTLNPHNRTGNPIISMESKENGLYYIFELATKDDIEILINMDMTDWRGYRVRIQKTKRFFTDYNDTEGGNIRRREHKKNNNLFVDSDNKLFMGGIPTNAKDKEVRSLVESFGQLKTFNLVKDPQNEELNRGFCFFEYLDEKVTERAVRGLHNLEMGERKLKIQRASLNSKSGTKAAEQKAATTLITPSVYGKSNFSKEIPMEKVINPLPELEVPSFASIPSRVIQIINVITPEDVMDDLEYREIVEDIRNECLQFCLPNGAVLNVEVPRPDKLTSIAGPAVGKIFVKFSTLQAAKKARYKLSGRKYNRRIVITSFYPENYFDLREFNFSSDK